MCTEFLAGQRRGTRRWAASALVASLCSVAADADAQLMLGHAMHSDHEGCHVRAGGHEFHLTSYVAPSEQATAWQLTPYCADLPAPGAVQITLLLGNAEDRAKPVAVRLVPAGGEASKGGGTFVMWPPRRYPSGVIELAPRIGQAGDYELTLSFEASGGTADVVTLTMHVATAPDWGLRVTLGALLGSGLVVITRIGVRHKAKKERA
jgi:hypothetical protein